MIRRDDLLTKESPDCLEVFQLTVEQGIPSSHVYMEAQIFHPDSRRFALHCDALPHGGKPLSPRHRFLLCDLDAGGALTPLTDEIGATAPSVDPTGKWMYYFVTEESTLNGGRFSLMRVGLDGLHRQTVCVVDSPLPGISSIPSNLYPLSTISSDGKRLAISAFVGDGVADNPDFGLIVFDLERGCAEVVMVDPFLGNAHAQYCRSTDPSLMHDLLIQHNHGCRVTPHGEAVSGLDAAGVDIHVIRDDGTNLRDVPVGRDRIEYCQGHQCWRGTSEWIIVGNGIADPAQKHGWGQQLIECRAADYVGHIGRKTPGAVRHHLSRDFGVPDFRHFQTDRSGERIVSDCGPFDEGGRLFFGRLGRAGEAAARWTYLLDLKCSDRSEAHAHPFLSPDGSKAFFNSDESGLLQAYMLTGLENLS